MLEWQCEYFRPRLHLQCDNRSPPLFDTSCYRICWGVRIASHTVPFDPSGPVLGRMGVHHRNQSRFLVAQGGVNGPRVEWKTLNELHTTHGARTKLVHRT